MRRPAAAAAAAALAVVALSPGAASAAEGRITQITADGAALRLVFAADSLPDGVTVDPASITVTVGGVPITDAKAVPVTGATVARSAALVIDTSGSMRGEGITGAKAAALAFLGAVPADVKVGLVTFADTAAVRVAPTTNRTALRQAVNALQPAGETALYDGVLLGLREAGKAGIRSVLVLSDGADTSSKATLANVLNAAKGSETTVDTVAFKTPDATGQVLGQVAKAFGGRSVAAGKAGDIGAAFRATARAISNQLVVTGTLPPTLKDFLPVAVTAQAGAETLAAEASVTVVPPTAAPTAAAGPIDVEVGALGSKGVLYAALGAVFAALLMILAVGLGGLSGDRQTGRMRRRLSLYTLTGRNAAPAPVESTALGESGVARSAVELADRVMRQRGFEPALAHRLERSGSSLKPAEWLLIHGFTTVGAALLLLLLTGGRILPTFLGFVLGFTGPYLYLSFRASRRANAFLAQMPDTLQLLSGSLSAGYSLPQAVDAVVREGAQPIAGEFSRAIVESRLGVPIEDALEGIALRMDSKDFGWVVMAIRIQREVGGNLAEVLGTVANTMRERERVRRQVRVLSAEGRLSGWILGGLPPVFAIYLVLVRPNYIKPLYTDAIGLLMLGIAAMLFTAGVFWLRKVVKVEV